MLIGVLAVKNSLIHMYVNQIAQQAVLLYRGKLITIVWKLIPNNPNPGRVSWRWSPIGAEQCIEAKMWNKIRKIVLQSLRYIQQDHVSFKVHGRKGCNPNPEGLGEGVPFLEPQRGDKGKNAIHLQYNQRSCFLLRKLMEPSKSNNSLNTHLRRRVQL